MSIDKGKLSWRKSAIDKQSDSICNQTVDILHVRVSKSRFWCRFWLRSCVISVSTDSQKKAEKEKPIDEDSSGLIEKLRKRRRYRLRRVYGNLTCTILFVDLCMPSITCVRHAVILWRPQTPDVGESDFFHQQLEARNTQTTVTLVNGKLATWKKKEQEEMNENSRLSGVLGPCVCTTVERWPEKEKHYKHERQRASKLCPWFNWKKKVQCTYSFEKTDFERLLAFEQASGVQIPLSVETSLTCCWHRSIRDDSCKKTGVKKWTYMKDLECQILPWNRGKRPKMAGSFPRPSLWRLEQIEVMRAWVRGECLWEHSCCLSSACIVVGAITVTPAENFVSPLSESSPPRKH